MKKDEGKGGPEIEEGGPIGGRWEPQTGFIQTSTDWTFSLRVRLRRRGRGVLWLDCRRGTTEG